MKTDKTALIELGTAEEQVRHAQIRLRLEELERIGQHYYDGNREGEDLLHELGEIEKKIADRYGYINVARQINEKQNSFFSYYHQGLWKIQQNRNIRGFVILAIIAAVVVIMNVLAVKPPV